MSQKTILVIDDEDILHTSIRYVLKDEPYNIVSAYNGKEGLECAIKYKPDLILLDLKMPIMTGFQFLEELKIESGCSTPIIILTGHGAESDKRVVKGLGGKFYLNKPFDADDLRALVKYELTFGGDGTVCFDGQKTILVIDDEEVIHESIRDVLENKSYTLVSAFNGVEGLDSTHRCKPDLILLDLSMPVKTGFQFLKELNEMPDDLPPIIVLTGYGAEKEINIAKRLGVRHFLCKPFNIKELRDVVGFELVGCD